MISITFSLLSLVALSVAQNQTVSLFLPNADPQSLVGSIVGGDATATTYVVQCADGGSDGAAATTSAAATTAFSAAITDSGDDGIGECGFLSPMTIVEGPSTVAYGMSIDDATVSINCVLSGTTVAVCTADATGAALLTNSVPSVTVATLSGTDVSYLPVVITAGSVSKATSTPASTTASTTGAAGTAKGGSTNSNSGTQTQTQTGSTTSASTQASGAAIHRAPAMGIGAAGALVAVAAVVL